MFNKVEIWSDQFREIYYIIYKGCILYDVFNSFEHLMDSLSQGDLDFTIYIKFNKHAKTI